MKIINRYTDEILIETESDTLVCADLSEADLSEAGLSGADLRWADLSEADLRWAGLRGPKLPKTDNILISPWGWCHIQRDNIRIGCQYHTTEEWKNFTDEEINAMGTGALEWWMQWKPAVMAMSEACEPYGKEK